MYERVRYIYRNSTPLHVPVPVVSSPAYQGPGDIYGAAVFWYGLRGFSAAYAAPGTNPAGRVKRADTTELDINILADGSLDEATLATFLTATTGTWIVLYDQSGNSRHLNDANDSFPETSLSALGVHTSIRTNTATPNRSIKAGDQSPAQAQPMTISAVYKRISGGSIGGILSIDDSNDIEMSSRNNGSDDVVTIYAGASSRDALATIGVTHAVQALYDNNSSALYVDGIDTSPLTLNSSAGTNSGQFIGLGLNPGVNTPNADIFEVGLWAGDKTAWFSDMNTNQTDYWGPF